MSGYGKVGAWSQVSCGPATLAFCQDVQAEAFDYPESFFEKRIWAIRRTAADAGEVSRLAEAIKAVGEFNVPVRLHRDVTAQIKVLVAAEGAPEAPPAEA